MKNTFIMKRKTNVIRKRLTSIALLFLILWGTLFAQDRLLSGTVYDNSTGEPLPGATVVLKGTSTGSTTDLDGKFSIQVASGETIVVSFVGYLNEELAVTDQTDIRVSLVPDLTELSEVVVVGYGTQKKIELTGAVSSVKSDEMVQVVASDFTKSLQGQVAGVSVTESSGRPGDEANVQIRGLGSISTSSSPLYVVDGIPFERNPNIASEDIESVEILKDGAAAAVYGTRASNGVILITTKRGKAGETKVSFSSYYGIQNITSGTPLLNTPEHIWVDEMNQRANGSNSPILYYNPNAIDYNTDWVDYITNDNAPIQNYNLTISGGQDKFSFNVNGNYFKQNGMLINSGYDRFSTRANTKFKKGRFEAFVSLNANNSVTDQEPFAIYELAIWQGPYRPPLDELEWDGSRVSIPGRNPDHLGYFAQQVNNTDRRKTNSYNLAANLKFEIITGLKFQMNIGSDFWNFERNYWQPQFLVYDQFGDLNTGGSRENAVLLEEFEKSQKITLENILTYDKSFGEHNLSLLAGYTMEKRDFKTVSAEKQNFIRNDIQVFDGGSEMTKIAGSEFTNGLVGKLFRVQYNYRSKYLLSASLRHDGSSKFGSSNRYALFPGASVGWNISEENFMSGLRAINNLKIRASYAEVGNEGIDPYLYAGYIDANIDYTFASETANLSQGSIQRGYANPDIKWEANISRNIGIDLLMYDGRFGANMDVYRNNKNDMLLNVLLPPSAGTNVPDDNANRYTSKIMNIGNMVNEGVEIQAFYKQLTAFKLGWKLTGVFTKNNNEVTSLGDVNSIPLLDSRPSVYRKDQQDVTTYMRPGYEAGSFFLIPTNGIIKTQEELNAVREFMPNAQLGDLKYVDQLTVDTDDDGVPDAPDGVINDDDRVYQGSGMPKFEAGLKADLTYRGFDLSMHFFYSHGNKVFNGSKLFAYSHARHKDLYYMWTHANANSDVMSARTNLEHDNFRSRSDYFLEDASFLRMRTLSLGYTFNKNWFKGHIENLRIYATGQNLFTITQYEGYDPEVGGTNIANRGIDRGNYPISRKFIIGVQLDF